MEKKGNRKIVKTKGHRKETSKERKKKEDEITVYLLEAPPRNQRGGRFQCRGQGPRGGDSTSRRSASRGVLTGWGSMHGLPAGWGSMHG